MSFFTPVPDSPDNEAIRELRDSVKDLNKSTRFSSIVMAVLTLALVILTGVLIWQGFGQ